MVALASLLDEQGLLASPAETKPTHAHPPLPAFRIPARAKSVIWLFMEGAPSSIDLFDYKPELEKRHGQPLNEKVDVFFGSPGPLMKSPFSFKQYGQSAAWVSDLYPTVAQHVDDIAFIRSVYAEFNNHAPALFQMNTGVTRPGFPSAGA